MNKSICFPWYGVWKFVPWAMWRHRGLCSCVRGSALCLTDSLTLLYKEAVLSSGMTGISKAQDGNWVYETEW